MLGRNELITNNLLERKAIAASLQLREGKTLLRNFYACDKTETTRMTDLVKVTVARGHVPPHPDAHVINYARGGVIELFMFAVSIVFTPIWYQLKKQHFI